VGGEVDQVESCGARCLELPVRTSPDRGAALGGMQAGVLGAGEQAGGSLLAGVDRLAALRALVKQQPPVEGAGKDRRQVP